MFDPESLLQSLGPYVLAGIFLIIFLEGVVFGALQPVPGDPTLFTAGLLAATGAIDAALWQVCLLVTAAAILGNMGGYWLGAKMGPTLLKNPNSRIFKKEYIDRTRAFFDRHGASAIILARFIPFARTFITLIAGISRMDVKQYLLYSSIGGLLWATGMTLCGALLGQIPWVRDNLDTMLLLLVAMAVLVTAVPVANSIRARRRDERSTRASA